MKAETVHRVPPRIAARQMRWLGGDVVVGKLSEPDLRAGQFYRKLATPTCAVDCHLH